MFYSSGSNIRWFAFVSWKGNCMSSQRETIATIDYSCVFAFAVYRDYHTIHHFRTCVGKTASDSSFLTKHVDFQLFSFGSCKKSRFIVLSLRVSLDDVSFQPARRSPFFPQPPKSSSPYRLHLTLGYRLCNLGLRPLIILVNWHFTIVILKC